MKGYILNDDKRLNDTMLYLIKQNCILYDSFLSKKDLDFILFGYNGLNEHYETTSPRNYCKLTEDFFKNLPATLSIYTVKKNETLKKLQEKYGFGYEALMDDETFVDENAWLTAEGLIGEILQHRPYQLSQSKIIVIGYGHCGQAIAELLCGFHVEIYIKEIDPKKQARVLKDGFQLVSEDDIIELKPDIIITTAIHSLDLKAIQHLPKETYYFDITSFPYGFNHRLNLKHDYLLNNIPASYGYKTIGKKIGQWIERRQNHA